MQGGSINLGRSLKYNTEEASNTKGSFHAFYQFHEPQPGIRGRPSGNTGKHSVCPVGHFEASGRPITGERRGLAATDT
jgi:hypothetical protein